MATLQYTSIEHNTCTKSVVNGDQHRIIDIL
ncbi:Uncharacterised protein [Vibrio cholerae]|nr:Uncharacterised protein [Vibrio cholerae]CSI57981.1 Uncharacterised protein [Vibrio cholerae]